MTRRIAENRTSAPSQSHSLSGCDESQIDPGGFAGIHVEVAQYDDGAYIEGDLIDDRLVRWSYEDGRLVCWPAPARPAFHESAGPVVGAGPAQTPGGVR